RHPAVKVYLVYCNTQADKAVSTIHQDLYGETNLVFSGSLNSEVDVLFLCLGHGNSEKFLKDHQFSDITKVIDLSTDFRDPAGNHDFIYGIPETRKEEIRKAMKVANPGCFATAINLALLPLAS